MLHREAQPADASRGSEIGAVLLQAAGFVPGEHEPIVILEAVEGRKAATQAAARARPAAARASTRAAARASGSPRPRRQRPHFHEGAAFGGRGDRRGSFIGLAQKL
jgi:hypothetical protein